MSSCKNCRYCANLNKIYICMRWKAEIEPKPNTICDRFIPRKYKQPEMIIDVNMDVDNAVDSSEQKDN